MAAGRPGVELVLPAQKAPGAPLGVSRAVQAVVAVPQTYAVSFAAADLPTPILATVSAGSSSQTLAIPDVPAGVNRVITVQGEDATGNPVAGAAWMAVASFVQPTTQVDLDAGSTAVGRAFARWLQTGEDQLAETASPSVVARSLDAIMSANRLPHYSFVDAASWADAVAKSAGNMDVGTAFMTQPAEVDVTLQGVPDDAPATLWVDDPASPVQTGLAPATSETETFAVAPVTPGSWTAWASVPGLGLASASVTVSAGGSASVTIAFPGWTPGPALPVPTGNAAVATDGRYLYVVGGVLEGGAETASCWKLDTQASSPAWTALPALPPQAEAREGAAAAVLGSTLYVVGGTGGGMDYDDAWSLDLTSSSASWAPLNGASAPNLDFQAHPTVPMAAIASGSDLLALWTFFDDIPAPPFAASHFASFDPGTGFWTYDPATLPAMRTPRKRAGVAVFDGALVVAGGDREAVEQGVAGPGTTLPAVATVEALTGGRWTAWPDLPAGRSELALAQAGNSLYAAGGVTADEVPVTDVYRYDPSLGEWLPAPPLGTARSSFGLLYVGGRLWAIGGSPAHQFNQTAYGSALALASVETLQVSP